MSLPVTSRTSFARRLIGQVYEVLPPILFRHSRRRPFAYRGRGAMRVELPPNEGGLTDGRWIVDGIDCPSVVTEDPMTQNRLGKSQLDALVGFGRWRDIHGSSGLPVVCPT
jgi:hypothetical protein